MLMEHETTKIKELDEQYSNELREWKAMLVPRKQVNKRFEKAEWLMMLHRKNGKMSTLVRVPLYLCLHCLL